MNKILKNDPIPMEENSQGTGSWLVISFLLFSIIFLITCLCQSTEVAQKEKARIVIIKNDKFKKSLEKIIQKRENKKTAIANTMIPEQKPSSEDRTDYILLQQRQMASLLEEDIKAEEDFSFNSDHLNLSNEELQARIEKKNLILSELYNDIHEREVENKSNKESNNEENKF